jgi:hypothetical protein
MSTTPDSKTSIPASVASRDLLPQHAQLLAESAILSDIAEWRGYASALDPKLLKSLGFADYQCRSGLLIPLHGVDGAVRGYQLRPDKPRNKRGKPVKYETPAGQKLFLVSHPLVTAHLGDPSQPLILTEGVRKADAGISAGHDALALLGVYGFRATNAVGGKTVIADFDSVALNGREIYIVFDSDRTLARLCVTNAEGGVM